MWSGQNVRQLSAQETQTLSNRNTALEEKGTYLVDDTSALADQSFTHTMQRLQVELIGSLGCHKLHRRALNGLCDRLRITKVDC
jgi:hypothetical protein